MRWMRTVAHLGPVGLCLTGLFLYMAPDLGCCAIRTLQRGGARGSPAVREALKAPTEDGRVEALIAVLTGEDLPAALEATEVLAEMGPAVVPRLVSEMQRVRNNWLIGGTLVKMGSEAVGPVLELLEDAEEQTAVDCIYLLGEIQDRRAVPTLVRYLEDPRDRVRMYSVTALLLVGGPRSVEAVLSRLTREGKGLEGFIVECLLRYGKKSVEPILQSLASRDPRVRREAAFLLGGLEDARAVEPLMAGVRDEDAGVRENAAYALGQLSALTGARQEVVLSLASLLSDPSDEVSEAARKALVRYGRAAVPTLVAACRGGGTREVVASLNALREIGDSDAEEVMIDALGHPDRRVRVAAVAGLITAGTGRSVEPLLNALRDEDLRWFAELALEKLGPHNPQLFFSARPNDPTMSVRTQILVRLGSAVVPVLTEYLRDDNVGRRAAAMWILGEIGDPSAARDLAWFLADDYLGWLAGRSLKKLGEVGLEELLRYVEAPPTDAGALQAVEALSLFDDPRAWNAIEQAVTNPIPRAARVRSAVLISLYGEPLRVSRVRDYLDGEGRMLWPEVEAALRAESRIQ